MMKMVMEMRVKMMVTVPACAQCSVMNVTIAVVSI